ncbi:MAG: hypothetical protein P9X22_07745 [Candidatus Zapsychrus exili]|nr:hypothetical protein [Candidatus Zapsychrus exili]
MNKKKIAIIRMIGIFIILQQPFTFITQIPHLENVIKYLAFPMLILYFLLGIGLFMLKEWVRWVFVKILILAVIIKLFFASVVFFLNAFGKGLGPFIRAGFEIFFMVLSLPYRNYALGFIITLFYIYFFTRPKVKEQFK